MMTMDREEVVTVMRKRMGRTTRMVQRGRAVRVRMRMTAICLMVKGMLNVMMTSTLVRMMRMMMMVSQGDSHIESCVYS